MGGREGVSGIVGMGFRKCLVSGWALQLGGIVVLAGGVVNCVQGDGELGVLTCCLGSPVLR